MAGWAGRLKLLKQMALAARVQDRMVQKDQQPSGWCCWQTKDALAEAQQILDHVGHGKLESWPIVVRGHLRSETWHMLSGECLQPDRPTALPYVLIGSYCLSLIAAEIRLALLAADAVAHGIHGNWLPVPVSCPENICQNKTAVS